MIEVDLAATNILESVHRNFGQENQRWLLVNNQGRYLADSDSELFPRAACRKIFTVR